VSTTLSPEQNVVGPLAVIVGVGGTGLITTVTGAEVSDTQKPSTTTTVKVPPVVTVIDCVVAPVLQTLPVGLSEVNSTLPPGQNCVGPEAVTVGAGGVGLIVTVVAADVSLVQLPSNTYTQ
jgi:hypothetical protein